MSATRAATMSAITAAIMAAATVSGCAKKEAAKPQKPASVPVVVASVSQKDVPLTLRSIGNVESIETVQIKSQVNGQIMEVHFKEGQDVNKGELLFALDPRQFQAELKKAESMLARDIAQAKNARVQAERYAKLMQEGVVAKQQYDQFVSSAEADEATVAADRAAVESSRVQLQYTKIYAPITGRTGNLSINRGNIVKANDLPLVTINQITPIYVQFAIPEQQLSEVKRYMRSGKLRIQAISSGGQPQPQQAASTGAAEPSRESADGELTFIDNAVDPATGTIKLKGTFANKSHNLWPGQFADVVLRLSTQPNAITVPSQAVQTGQQGQFVFVINPDMTADMRPVEVQRTFNGESIITKGLQAGERVVVDGQLRLTKGSKVEIKAAAAGAAPMQAVPEPLS